MLAIREACAVLGAERLTRIVDVGAAERQRPTEEPERRADGEEDQREASDRAARLGT